MLRRDLLFLVKSASTLSSGPRGQTERSNPRVKKRAKRAAEVPFTLELGNNIQVTVDTVTKPFSMNKSNNGTRTNVEASSSASAGGLLKNDDNPDTSIVVNESSLLADSGDSLSESSVGEVFDTLKHTALPLLASTVQAMQLERVPDADSAHSTAAVFSPDKMRALVYDEARLASLTSAVECVTSSLSSIHTLKKTTGRRYEPAFPALLTASLWRQVGPLLQQIDHTMQAGRGKGTGSTDALTNANLRNIQVRYAAAFKQLRRALALRTRDVTDVLTPNQVVESIAYMQLCGALSDDVLGPMVADLKRRQEQQDPLRRPPSHHSLLSHLVSTVPAGEHILQKGGATVLLRVLGRQSVPGHFHLHQFIHTTLLPAVRDELAAAESLSEVALVDLTRCFVRYEVTGDYVEHLSRLWRPYLSSLRTTDCGNLLRLLTAPPAWAAEDPQRARPKGSRALRRLRKGGAAVNAAAEDYLPLIQEVCEVIVERGRQILQAGPTTATVGELQGWLELYPTLLQVNSPSWAEVYLTSADSIYYLLGEACKAHAADGAEKWWQTVLPVEQAERAIRSLIHRSTLIPEHPLHALLLKRLLYDPASKKSPPTANLALLSMELMTVDKRDDLMGYANHHGEEEQKEEKSVLSTEDSYYHTMRSYFSPTITADDAQQALALLRTHKAKLGATSFIAAMCVAPLWELPVPMQQGVLNHFTSIASGVTPEWLIKGVAAATHLQMMHDTNRHAHSPVVVADAVSVKRWLSRFTLGDVTRQVGIDGCTTLLEIFQLKDSYSVDNALAKSNVVHRVGFSSPVMRWRGRCRWSLFLDWSMPYKGRTSFTRTSSPDFADCCWQRCSPPLSVCSFPRSRWWRRSTADASCVAPSSRMCGSNCGSDWWAVQRSNRPGRPLPWRRWCWQPMRLPL
ncbi:hypothetical protein AGDE_14805 [Angomonas deanei]|uniref:Uncharacterized protein n=1 Tax=Angomonas deanei TaxID=59799 RepID=A0A7G2CP06_9TRYP|nr:hypothetical protein AGDE_14805 [Angomonas deanei]CAD2221225.1 hypothetical protein, conserved [Angomonas deanei]|eukprot:EPY20191.1 hypothetical protein AGDE_14805 [Angomonas deanei]